MRKQIAWTNKVLKEASRDFPWHNKEAYAHYIAQTYYYVSHSTRLLGLAASRLGPDRENFHKRFMEHAGEEKGHHILALNDLKALGKSLEDLPLLPETAAFFEPQYYKIEYQSPLALLGYILCLEAFAVADGRRIYQEIEKAHGKAAGTFMKVHAEDDPDHVQKALKVTEGLDEKEMAFIERNLIQTCHSWINLMKACQTAAQGASLIPFKKVA
jgi:pyrroloquinoline quinone (PQQ) biosynthesis protein C